ncbi:hypothetical protein [uncultured Ilyobacter sp.]|uniref:hypothetical protein n=1 Tax=uncultured Ilyobacter sp. TaxID=544433 RepID=UPI003748AE7A
MILVAKFIFPTPSTSSTLEIYGKDIKGKIRFTTTLTMFNMKFNLTLLDFI